MKMLLKDKNTRTLASGDKVTRLVLETTEPEQVEQLSYLDTAIMVEVDLRSDE